jgi:predicted nucleic acid-binding protein
MIAERWGVLNGERQLAGRPLNIADGMIAATADCCVALNVRQ